MSRSWFRNSRFHHPTIIRDVDDPRQKQRRQKCALSAVSLTLVRMELFLLVFGARVGAPRSLPRLAGIVVMLFARPRFCIRLPRSGKNYRETAFLPFLGNSSLTLVNVCNITGLRAAKRRFWRAEADPSGRRLVRRTLAGIASYSTALARLQRERTFR